MIAACVTRVRCSDDTSHSPKTNAYSFPRKRCGRLWRGGAPPGPYVLPAALAASMTRRRRCIEAKATAPIRRGSQKRITR